MDDAVAKRDKVPRLSVRDCVDTVRSAQHSTAQHVE